MLIPCTECQGDGWTIDHGDECYATGECVGGEQCPTQRQCDSCYGQGGQEISEQDLTTF